MGETVVGGIYLSTDGVTYHDANGKPVEMAQAIAPRALTLEGKAVQEHFAATAPAPPVETLVQQTKRIDRQNMSPRKG